MIDLMNTEDVKALQSNLRAVFEPDAGKEVMKFLEQICGWYDFTAIEKDQIMICHGKRQVLATLKTLMKANPEEVRDIVIEGSY